MIDWNNAKPGATVKFRCGGEAVITRSSVEHEPVTLSLANYEGTWTFQRDGRWRGATGRTPSDIIEIIPSPEPKRETVMLYWNDKMKSHCTEVVSTHIMYFDNIDGIPDCASIRMEAL